MDGSSFCNNSSKMSAYNFEVLILLLLLCDAALICKAASKMNHAVKKFPTSVKNYKLSNEDIILCVPVEDQPSLAKGDKGGFSAKPSAFYKSSTDIKSFRHQLFASEVGSCDKHTIPILYTSSNSVKKLTKLHQTSNGKHEHAYGKMTGNFIGMETTISIWNPYVELKSEFSLAQLWVISQKEGPLNTIEAGWQVFPEQYGGDSPRLFVYWTAHDYNKSGCYNLDCEGFVQVSNKYVLGGTYSETSTPGSTQHDNTFLVFQDSTTDNWWLNIDGEDIGYWPASLFNSLKKGFEIMETGGEVYYDAAASRRHTRTQMGSGKFAAEGFGQAAYIKKIQYLDLDSTFQPALKMTKIDEAPGCYTSSEVDYSNNWGVYFFFGGPGFSSTCP